MRRTAAAIALVVATLTAVSGQPGVLQVFPLQPFTAISICAPFNVLISPNNTAYQLLVDADVGVSQAINATVDANGVLTLSTKSNAPTAPSFKAPDVLKVALQLPADKLASVAVSSVPMITVGIAPGFAVPNFTVSLSGTSTLSAVSIKAGQLQLVNSGTGSLYVAGTITSATLATTGTGTTYIVGVTTSAAIDASGISKVFVSGGAANQITGQVSGISSVVYDQGTCTISSEFGGIFGAPCSQAPIAAPATLTTPQWSCALTAYGFFDCSDGSSSSSSVGNGGTTSASSFSSGGGSTFTSTTSNGVTTTSTSSSASPPGTSSLVTNSGTLQEGVCNATGAALNMF